MAHGYFAPVDIFSFHKLIEKAAEGIFPRQANRERRARRGSFARRPFNELCEIQKERGLDLRFRGLARLKCAKHRAETQQQSGDSGSACA